MDKKLLEVAKTGEILTESYTTTGLVDKDSLHAERVRLERNTIGERAKIRYRCPNCYAEFTTQKRYKVHFNWFQDLFKHFTFRRLISVVTDNTVGNVPIVGDTLSVHAEQRDVDQQSRKTDKYAEQVRIKAFEKEMLNNFMLTKSNNHGVCCKNCEKK